MSVSSERVRAVPKGNDRRAVVPAVLLLLMTSTAVLLALALRRWRRNGEESLVVLSPTTAPAGRSVASPNQEEDETYEERLDDELRALE